ncbi:MAG: DNA-protecting protein DprA, partial [Allosphingosinicella sp.]
VMEAISPLRIRPFRMPERSYTAPAAEADADAAAREAVTGLLNGTRVPVDELIRQSNVPPAIVHTVLLELELAGRLERHAGGQVSLA